MATKKSVKVKKMDGLSSDVQQEKIDALKSLVPEAFADGKIDVERLKKLVGEDVVASDERYRLEWSGKSEVFNEIAERSSCTLTLDEQRSSKDWKDSNNIFIEGENLEVLRTLQKAYHGKVKMIYIDPPYNTGKDFVYNDNFRESEEDYCEDDCNVDENGLLKKAYKLNSRDSGRFHSNWLSMMYSRLYLARNLMRDDGVIFVSIDDNEVHNLRMLMNEVFGEENFVGQIIWEKRVTRENRRLISVRHDYILFFTKNSTFMDSALSLSEMDDEALSRYKNPDNDKRGVWTSAPATAQAGHATKSQFYELTTPSGRKLNPPTGRCWLYSKERISEEIEKNNIWFGADGNGVPRIKKFLNEGRQGLTPETLWKSDFAGTNDSAKRQLKNLFGGVSVFDTPKPVLLLKKMLEVGSGEDSIIVDFFTGSAPTPHAVMEKNAEDGGSRKYICVQMPEETPEGSESRKAGYKKISDIAIDRIKKAAVKIKKDHPTFKGDLGVRVYKETDSHFPQWHSQAFKSDADLEQAMIDYSKAILSGTAFDRATEILLKLGYPLTTQITERDGFMTAEDIALVLDAKFPIKNLEKVLVIKPKTVVVLEKLFKKDEEKINFALRCKEAKVIFQTV
jgi:adenine-specific DNA-methyltransferase